MVEVATFLRAAPTSIPAPSNRFLLASRRLSETPRFHGHRRQCGRGSFVVTRGPLHCASFQRFAPSNPIPMCEVRQRLREQARRAQAPVEGGVAAETAPTVSTGGPGGSTPAGEVPQSRGRRATEEAKTEGKSRNPRAQKKCEIALPTPRGSVGLGGGEGGCTAVANDVAVMWRTRSRASSIHTHFQTRSTSPPPNDSAG
ncbi:hypothetical protein BSKO_09664 [Bryopsis sp. KO-2023]|nr:hypothetical protein BSKO_09664 [Bryopsis sp. KO-2023]